MKLLIGQRVIYQDAISTIYSIPDSHKNLQNKFDYYINNPKTKCVHGVAKKELKTLPYGQK